MSTAPPTSTTVVQEPSHLSDKHPTHPGAEIADDPGNGSADPADDHWDDIQHSRPNLFPTVDSGRSGSGSYTARTSFRIGDAKCPEGLPDPTRWTRLKRLHHDIGPDYSGSNRRRDILRRDARYRELDSILQRIDVPDSTREWAIDRALTEEIRGFNREHNGSVGAVLGFVLLDLADDLPDALDSRWFEEICSVVDNLPDEDVDLDPVDLVEYVFDREGAR